MKKLFYFIICIPALLWLTSCDVHELPKAPEYVKLRLQLNYETDMTIWENPYDETAVIYKEPTRTYDNQQKSGKIRYIVRTYPVLNGERAAYEHSQEFIFTKDIEEGYNHEITLNIRPGNYDIKVWSDLVSTEDDSYYYDAKNFAEVRLQGEYEGNNNYRDSFHGNSTLSLYPNKNERHCDTVNITMKRPLAKFEIIANDLSDFIAQKTDDIDQVKARILYVGFMPDAYSLFTHRPVDSKMGVIFESPLKILPRSRASLCFDYVFVNENVSTVMIKIGIYDKDGTLLSMTENIKVPLKLSHHTILTGDYLMQNASGDIKINPDYDGNYNLILP